MNNFILKSRIESLKAMHTLMMNGNDERIYMTWIYTMPDEPQEDDFEWFAEDDERFKEIYELFCRLIQNKGWI